jgi:hypothetical protein
MSRIAGKTMLPLLLLPISIENVEDRIETVADQY